MFGLDLTPNGYMWSCTIGPCEAQGLLTNPGEACNAALAHRDEQHAGHRWSQRYQDAVRAAKEFLETRDLNLWQSDGTHASPLALIDFVAAMSEVLTPPGIVLPQPVAPVDPYDIRNIPLQDSLTPPRNWSTNHQVRWALHERIQMPPEGQGCKATGARVGDEVEICALPLHNAVNVAHVFAIGGRVTRIAND